MVDFKQLEKYDSWKVAKYSYQTMYGVNWCVNITILAISQFFPKCSDFIICRKAETKKCNTLIEDKGKSNSNIARSK